MFAIDSIKNKDVLTGNMVGSVGWLCMNVSVRLVDGTMVVWMVSSRLSNSIWSLLYLD